MRSAPCSHDIPAGVAEEEEDMLRDDMAWHTLGLGVVLLGFVSWWGTPLQTGYRLERPLI